MLGQSLAIHNIKDFFQSVNCEYKNKQLTRHKYDTISGTEFNGGSVDGEDWKVVLNFSLDFRPGSIT